MSNDGFKGTRLGISSITIKGSNANVEVQFVDEDGFVHATTRHSIPIGENEALRETGEAFLTAITNHISGIHFNDPETSGEQKETRSGIAEALRRGGSDDSDGFEEGS